jgi:hypothetical protein
MERGRRPLASGDGNEVGLDPQRRRQGDQINKGRDAAMAGVPVRKVHKEHRKAAVPSEPVQSLGVRAPRRSHRLRGAIKEVHGQGQGDVLEG